MRPFRAIAPLIAILLALALAACDSGGPQPTALPPTRTPTPPPVVTRIVPPPSATPAPTPAPVISEAMGEWALRITLDVTGWSFAERLSYFGAATFTVDEQGAIEGSGYFSSNIDGGRCLAQPLDDDPLTFRLSGSVEPSGSGKHAELRLIPDQRFLAENFRIICPDDLGGVREHRAPLLWPALARLDLLAWSLTLETGERFTLEGDLGATPGEVTGTLTGEAQVTRR